MQATATIVTMACCSPQNAVTMTQKNRGASSFFKKMKIFFGSGGMGGAVGGYVQSISGTFFNNLLLKAREAKRRSAVFS
jgi:hypothetical protein